MRGNRKAFTLIELLVVLFILGIVAAIGISVICGGVAGLASGGYFEERAATIEVIRLYPIASESGTSYRCYAKVLSNPSGDENLGEETTFEITDSFMKGQLKSADLCGKLREGEVFEVVYYGVRVGWASQFPKIIAVNRSDRIGGGIEDLYDD